MRKSLLKNSVILKQIKIIYNKLISLIERLHYQNI